MTQAQPSTSAARPRYEALLGDRITWGRLYADHLSHLQEVGNTPIALCLFQRLLQADAALAGFRRYDLDLFRVVIPAEDARMHLPPDLPPDHVWAPCSLCRRSQLRLAQDVVLPPVLGGAR